MLTIKKTTKVFYIFLIVLVSNTTQAQDYQISFAGSGASTTVDSVQVQNLTKGTSLTLNGSDILHLTGTTGIKSATTGNKSLQIYPNPMTTDCNVEFEIQEAGLVSLDLFDITGRKASSFQKVLANGLHTLHINGLNAGVYTLIITTEDGSYSGKIISNSKIAGIATINYVNSVQTPTTNIDNTEKPTTTFRSAQTTTVDMLYKNGDRILLKGMSGNYSTIISIVPTASSTQTFNFVAATDCDGNNYSTVTIGTQIWMVENLKTTKYNDCTPIPNEKDNHTWSNLTTGAYRNYQDDTTKASKYGRLYNWYAVNTGKLAPIGWHVPSKDEWITFNSYVDLNLIGTSGSVGKAISATTDWVTSTNNAAIGNKLYKNNNAGFSALPAGYCRDDGNFYNLLSYESWWSSTEYNSDYAWYRDLFYDLSFLDEAYTYKASGLSVRCVKD